VFNYVIVGSNLTEKRDTVVRDLSVAQSKLTKDKNNLVTMKSTLSSTFALAFNAQDQIRKSSDLVKQTNFMFNNADGLNPELIVKNLSSSGYLNNERKSINLILAEWQKELDLLSLRKIDIAESEKIKKDAETIKNFIKELAKVVAILTPGNSGFTQLEIDSYSAQFPSIDSLDQILASLGNSIQNSKDNAKNNNSVPESGNSDEGTPLSSVTPEQVLAQQELIIQEEARIAALQVQLALLQQQIQQSFPDNNPPAPEPVVVPEVVPTDIPIPESPTPTPITPDPYVNKRVINRDDYQGIIVQPGPPRLIQGIDQY
jgi:hypothetical protein